MPIRAPRLHIRDTCLLTVGALGEVAVKRYLVLGAVVLLVAAVAAVAVATEARPGALMYTGCMDRATGELDQVKPGDTPRGGACDGARARRAG